MKFRNFEFLHNCIVILLYLTLLIQGRANSQRREKNVLYIKIQNKIFRIRNCNGRRAPFYSLKQNETSIYFYIIFLLQLDERQWQIMVKKNSGKSKPDQPLG